MFSLPKCMKKKWSKGLLMEQHVEGHYEGWQAPHKISVFLLQKKKVIAIEKKRNQSLKETCHKLIVIFHWHVLSHWAFGPPGSSSTRLALCLPAAVSPGTSPARDALHPTEAKQKVGVLSSHSSLSDCRQAAGTLAHDTLAFMALEDVRACFLVNIWIGLYSGAVTRRYVLHMQASQTTEFHK